MINEYSWKPRYLQLYLTLILETSVHVRISNGMAEVEETGLGLSCGVAQCLGLTQYVQGFSP